MNSDLERKKPTRKARSHAASGLPHGTLLGRIIVGLLIVFIALPLVWLAYSAFLPKEALFSGATVPTGFTLSNFVDPALESLGRPLIISLLGSSLVVILQLTLALPAAYALKTGTKLLGVYLLFLAVPIELLLIPLYGLLSSLGLLNTPWALVLPFIANPFAVFLLYSGLTRLPQAYIEAARIDGAGTFAILTRVIAPLLRPELTAAAVLGFAAHWNLVLYPRVVQNDPSWWTVQVALTELLRQKPNEWGLLGAAAILTSLPIFLLYLFFERRVTRTIEGGLK